MKIGGSLASSSEELRRLMQSIEDLSNHHTLVIVPGGGPFADNVRELQVALNASDSSAHWMAILAMEQFGELLSQYAPSLDTFSGKEIVDLTSN
ncbi:MAG: uridylate kinase, partial [Candidatus Thorarchaeota archaeon]